MLFIFFFFIQVMTCRPRSDLFINLPALRKLDNMLIVSIYLLFFAIIQLLISFIPIRKSSTVFMILNSGMSTKGFWHQTLTFQEHFKNHFNDKRRNGGFQFHESLPEVLPRSSTHSFSTKENPQTKFSRL